MFHVSVALRLGLPLEDATVTGMGQSDIDSWNLPKQYKRKIKKLAVQFKTIWSHQSDKSQHV